VEDYLNFTGISPKVEARYALENREKKGRGKLMRFGGEKKKGNLYLIKKEKKLHF
jgi:hypothetical protein